MTKQIGSQQQRLGLFLQMGHHWSRAIAQGIFRTMRAATGWQPHLLPDAGALQRFVANDNGASWVGIIGQFYPPHRDLLARLDELGIATVNVSGWQPPKSTLWIHNDDGMCGEMAAAFFADRGFRHFAFMGVPGYRFSDQRMAGFQNEVQRRSLSMPIDLTPPQGKLAGDIQHTVRKLIELPKPCALFACNDQRAKHCLSAAELAGLSIPDTIAIIGVDDDDIFCEMSPIPLSSVRPDWHRIGAGAVELLLAIHSQNKVPPPQTVAPVEVVARLSSDASAIDDPLAAAAIQYIHHNIDNDINSDLVARALGVSRRTLERRLIRSIGHSSHRAISAARMQRAYQQVISTRLAFGEIAWICGFAKQSQFNAAFKKAYGNTPTQARHAAGFHP